MTTDQIKAIQAKIGTVPDGFYGPKSIAACQAHLRSLMPKPHPWPATDQSSLTKFYGAAGDESKLVNMPVGGIDVRYDGKRVKTIRCHAKVEKFLGRIIAELSESHPEILRKFAGCFNNRPMTNGTLPSIHARGAAIDFWPELNGNLTHWPEAATMPFEVMETFARYGFLSAGAFWGRDACHFQATR